MNTEDKAKLENSFKDLPGAAIDAADAEKADAAEVKERTKVLNDNPRNTDDAMPVNPA
ncbi:MAG: hypothetical protein K2M19_00320 [Muribaculaceae bacterium]|nr:hypothetical protein [Muribaculaceae bacterium]